MRNYCTDLLVRSVVFAGLIFCCAAALAQSEEQSKRTSAKNAVLLEQWAAGQQAPPIQPLIGQYETYTAKKGETLFQIARSRMVSVSALQRLNNIETSRVKAGTRLILPTLHIVPLNPGEGVVLNVPERAIYVFKGAQLIARYPVAIGKSGWQTALGDYKIRNMVKDPTWKPTREMVEREGVSPDEVPAGQRNPLGDRWMGWSTPGFGFHSTTSPRSIGTAASHGCVRMYPEAAHKLYDQVTVGMPIHSIYEPVVVGKMNGKFYLSVFPDIYKTGQTDVERIHKRLKSMGLLDAVDPTNLQKIISRADGYPHRIMGADEEVTVNGMPVSASVVPSRVNGQWIVPVREYSQALGGQLSVAADGRITVTGNGRTLTLKAGDRLAEVDGKPLNLEVAPSVVQGTTLAPLGALTQALGAKVTQEKGKSLQITSVGGVGRSPVIGAPPVNSVPGGR